ncbi:hypothetical protein J6590_058820 [Homalodisca vitripennis]|nr:hypothetical protein J6590_058820 [Homalodisca vitripennis]
MWTPHSNSQISDAALRGGVANLNKNYLSFTLSRIGKTTDKGFEVTRVNSSFLQIVYTPNLMETTFRHTLGDFGSY